MPRTIRKGFGEAEGTIPWNPLRTAMVNHYYFYCVDEDFGPFFIKFCSYFPYTGKLCINGHEYLNGQLARRGIEFEALDNGLLRCANPACHTRRPPWFCLWTHGSAGVYATYEMQVSCRKQSLSSRPGVAPPWRAWPSKQTATLPKSGKQIERCVISTFQVAAESLGFKGDFRQWEHLL